MVGLQLGTQQPLFALIVAGDNIYAASGSTALLQVLLLFLRLCQLELGGSLGGRHIQHLELSHVLKQYRWGGLACQPGCASGLATRSMVWGGVRQMERACPAQCHLQHACAMPCLKQVRRARHPLSLQAKIRPGQQRSTLDRPLFLTSVIHQAAGNTANGQPDCTTCA